MNNTYRIRKRDRLNWVIERFEPGGRPIVKGRGAGGVTREGWDELRPLGYFARLRDAATSLFDVMLGEEWPTEGWTGQNLTVEIDTAVKKVLATIADSDESVSTTMKIDMAPDLARTIEAAFDPVREYLKVTGGKRFKRTQDETSRKLSPKDAVLERMKKIT